MNELQKKIMAKSRYFEKLNQTQNNGDSFVQSRNEWKYRSKSVLGNDEEKHQVKSEE